MALFKKGTPVEVFSNDLKKNFVVPFNKLAITKSSWSKRSIYDDCVKLCHIYIRERTEPENSFLIFGMVFGENGEHVDIADNIWTDVFALFLKDPKDEKEVFDFLKKVLGTILMIQIADDKGIWEYESDKDKQQKLSNKEIPDAAIYNLRTKLIR